MIVPLPADSAAAPLMASIAETEAMLREHGEVLPAALALDLINALRKTSNLLRTLDMVAGIKMHDALDDASAKRE